MRDQRTYKDRRQYLLQAVAKRRLKIRQLAIAYKGSKCQLCGYHRCPQALDFHHRDQRQKSFGISAKGYTRSWKTVQSELDKCILLCANCHREVHVGITQLPVETLE